MRKANLNINENYEEDLAFYTQIKYEKNKTAELISNLEIRKNMSTFAAIKRKICKTVT